MAKSQPVRPAVKPKESKPLLPVKYQDWIYTGAILVAVFIFFSAGIFGSGFSAQDIIASESFAKYVEQAKAQGVFPQWIPYIFGGMPSFGALLTTGDRLWDFFPEIFFGFVNIFGKIFANDAARVAMYYFFYGAGVYWLMRSKKFDAFVSFFTSFAAVFSTGIVLWVMIGHNTKPVVFAMMPWIFLFLEKLRVKFSLLYAALLVVVVHIMMEGTHVQMIFYVGSALGLYLVFELVSRLFKKNQPLSVLRAAAVLAVAFGLAYLMASDRYMSIQEYTKYSTRGSAPLVQSQQNKQDATGGNDYGYATMWSFSPQEIVTFFVPNYYGFGKLTYKGNYTGGQEVKVQTYWGQKVFEDAAPYMGIFVLMMAVCGAWYARRDVFVQFLMALSAFALLLSFGNNFPLLFDIFYYNVPMFNKFRAPSMALALLQFAVPILAGYGLAEAFRQRNNPEKRYERHSLYLIFAAGAFLVFGFLFGAAFKESYLEAVSTSKSYRMGPEFLDFVWSSMISDWYVTALIALVAAALFFFFIKRKLGVSGFSIALIVLLGIDLWRVGWRPMEISKKKIEKEVFRESDWVNFIKQDKGVFRIADFVWPSPNVAAHFGLESVNGYHSAKLRIYQDMLDATSQGSTSGVTSPFMWSLLNVKYIITPQELGPPPAFRSQEENALVYVNEQRTPRAYFVARAERADAKTIVGKLKAADFNPRQVAYLETTPPAGIDSAAAENATVQITGKTFHEMKMKTRSSATGLLVVSEIYYPSWKAYIDGKEVPILKTDYILRSIVVPAGEHTIEMRYVSEKFETGKTLSLASNVLVLALLGLGAFFELRNRKKDGGEPADEIK